MYVVFDTSAIYPDSFFNGTQFQILMSSTSRLGITVVMPQVVVDELTNKHRESVEKLESVWKSLETEARTVFGRHRPPLQRPWDSESLDYASFLSSFLKENGCMVLPYPTVAHVDVVQAIFAKRSPFQKGEKGYRDYLIWHSILEFFARADEQIAFVTSNTSDFGSGKLNDSYMGDLQRVGPGRSIALFQTVAAFNEVHVQPTLAQLDELAAQLNADTFAGFSVKSWAASCLLSSIEENEYESGFSPLPSDHGHVTLTNWQVKDTKVYSVLRLGNNDIIVRAVSDYHVHRTFNADDYEFEYADVREFFSQSQALPGEHFWCFTEGELDGSVAFSLILDEAGKVLKEIEIDRITADTSTAFTPIGKNW
jgi:hypothetical protein